MDDFVVAKLTEYLPGLIETFRGNLISCHLRIHGFILHFVTSVSQPVYFHGHVFIVLVYTTDIPFNWLWNPQIKL